ncbi:tRNA wybutosine-synthesizing protein 5 isoform X2 [Ornithorhynchus anatinus]|uniref:tRNA wybutosine-synthesizing protein 5 isoform X2 n=1 Tax=Ornithorhynchus anatinus TaxID=9258 RepID=UPI0010A78BEE|nr:tRNA wybutosine-synthesizing protein 5 isoform X2 [Ornithorhynchus anatinus]
MSRRVPVSRLEGVTRDQFLQLIYPQRKPVVLRGLELGPCTTRWTAPDYLCRAGGRVPVKIHVSAGPQMDFISKNFVYRTLPFDTFVQRAAEEKHASFFISEDERYYLRSLGDDPRKVMDNLLIQVTGKKRVVLFSPRDAEYLYLSGGKSAVLDVDDPDLERFPLFSKARRYECSLEGGDVLFIPALWFHNVISEEFGVGVNVFWKHLPADCYDKSDPYGNRDPTAASRAVRILDRALKTLGELPEEYRDFYGRQMVLRVRDKAYSTKFE